MGVGLYYISQIFGRGGQFFWGNFRILLHFYYQIFSKNLGWGVCHLGGSTFGRGGGKAIETRGDPPTHPHPHVWNDLRMCLFSKFLIQDIGLVQYLSNHLKICLLGGSYITPKNTDAQWAEPLRKSTVCNILKILRLKWRLWYWDSEFWKFGALRNFGILLRKWHLLYKIRF